MFSQFIKTFKDIYFKYYLHICKHTEKSILRKIEKFIFSHRLNL